MAIEGIKGNGIKWNDETPIIVYYTYWQDIPIQFLGIYDNFRV